MGHQLCKDFGFYPQMVDFEQMNGMINCVLRMTGFCGEIRVHKG